MRLWPVGSSGLGLLGAVSPLGTPRGHSELRVPSFRQALAQEVSPWGTEVPEARRVSREK